MNRLTEFARAHRKKPTKAEAFLWDHVRAKRLGFKVSRQKPLLNAYIVDFYIGSFGIVIEIDGGYHDTKEQIVKDALRTKRLNDYGIRVIRFTNEEVLESIESVLERIVGECQKRKGWFSWRKAHNATIIHDKPVFDRNGGTMQIDWTSPLTGCPLREIIEKPPVGKMLKITWEYVNIRE